MKKILMVLGRTQYGVLNIFIQQMADAFKEMGIAVDICDKRNTVYRNTKQYIERYDAVISFNGAWCRDSTEALLWNQNIPVWSFLVDHPVWQDNKLMSDNRNQIISCVDRNHVEYVKEIYPNNNHVFFIPHGGIITDSHTAWEEKIYDVSFFGTYQKPESFLENMLELNEMMQEILIRIVERLYIQADCTLEGELRKELERVEIDISKEEFRNLMCELKFIDSYVRSMKRHDVIETLLCSGIVVDVFGNGWEEFESEHRRNLRIHGAVEHEKVLEEMARSKIVLNVMPLFADGSHERVFTTMGTRSICFTDESRYLRENFVDKEEIFFYSMQELELLPKQVKDVLEEKYNIAAILERAFEKVSKYHTWKNRAKDIIANLEKLNFYSEPIIEVKNETDYGFHQLLEHVSNVTLKQLICKMKTKFVYNQHMSVEDLQAVSKGFQAYSYLGTWEPVNGDFGVIEERAFELKVHIDKFVWLYSRLGDVKSKKILKNVLLNWETLNADLLTDCARTSEYRPYFDEEIIRLQEGEVFVDIGFENEKTVRAFLAAGLQRYKSVYSYCLNDEYIETFKENINGIERINVFDRENILSLDKAVQEKITFIKIDSGGMESDVLIGARKHIIEEHPKLAVSVFYGNRNIWRLAEQIYHMDHTYRFYMRYYGGNLYPNGIVLYAV